MFRNLVDRLNPWMPWVLSALLLCAIGSRLHIVPQHVRNIGFSEPNVIDGIIRVMDGLPLYGDPEQPPYDIIQYAPIHYGICAPICALFHLTKDDPQGIFMVSRSVCLVANLLEMLVLWGFARYLRLNVWSRILLLGLMFTWLHEPYFSRSDSLYQLFCACLFCEAFKGVDSASLSWRRAMLCGMWSALALFSKQSGVGPVAGVALGILIACSWRSAIRFGICALVANLLFLGLVEVTDGVDQFYKNVVLGNVNGFKFPWFAFDVSELYIGMGKWITPAALLAAWSLRGTMKGRAWFLLSAMVITYAWAFLTAFKVGSNMNYFMEHWLLCAITCLLFVQRGLELGKGPAPVLLLALTAVFGLRAMWFTKVFGFSDYPPDETAEYYDDLEAVKDLREHGLRPNDGVFVVGTWSFTEQMLGTQAWLKHEDILNQSREKLPLDHSMMFDNDRNGALRYVLRADSTKPLGQGAELFIGWEPTFKAGRYTVYERERPK